MIRFLSLITMLSCLTLPFLSFAQKDSAKLQRLIDALFQNNYKVRLQAALSLAKVKDKRTVPALIRGLSDQNAMVRRMVAYALGQIGDTRAIPALKERLKDKESGVRQYAEDALKRIGKPKPPTVILLTGVGDKTKRHGYLLADMRRLWTEKLKNTPNLELASAKPTQKEKYFELNTLIKQLAVRREAGIIEAACVISLVLSDQKASIVMMVDGEATVQEQLRKNATAQEQSITKAAMTEAIASAYSFLLQYFQR